MKPSLIAALSLSVVALAPRQGHAALDARAIALDAAGELVGVLHDLGAHLVLDGGALTYSCPALGAAGERLIATGSGRVLVAGAAGVALSFDTGCKWRAMLGAAGVAPIVGAHIHPTAPQRVAFALGGDAGAKLAVTGDGGFGSDLLASLVVAETRVTGMVGQGERLLLAAVEAGGGARAWLSPDFGATVAPVPLGLVGPLDDDPVPAALVPGQEVAFLWHGGALKRWDLTDGALSEERTFSLARAPASADADGVLWLAAGAEGLWRRGGDGAWSLARSEPAWALEVRVRRLWVGGSGRVDEPWVVASGDGGLTFDAVVSTPSEARYPGECASLATPTCRDAAAGVREAVEVDETAGEGAEPGEGASAATGGCGTGAAPGGLCWLAWFAAVGGIGRRRHAP